MCVCVHVCVWMCIHMCACAVCAGGCMCVCMHVCSCIVCVCVCACVCACMHACMRECVCVCACVCAICHSHSSFDSGKLHHRGPGHAVPVHSTGHTPTLLSTHISDTFTGKETVHPTQLTSNNQKKTFGNMRKHIHTRGNLRANRGMSFTTALFNWILRKTICNPTFTFCSSSIWHPEANLKTSHACTDTLAHATKHQLHTQEWRWKIWFCEQPEGRQPESKPHPDRIFRWSKCVTKDHLIRDHPSERPAWWETLWDHPEQRPPKWGTSPLE